MSQRSDPVSLGAVLDDDSPYECKKCRAMISPIKVGGGRFCIRPPWCSACVKQVRDAEEAGMRRLQVAQRSELAELPSRLQGYRWEVHTKPGRGESAEAFRSRVISAAAPTVGIHPGNVAAARSCRDWLPQHGSLYLCGKVGGGKSTLIAAMVDQLCAADLPCWYLTDGVLWRRWLDREAPERRARDVRVLVWDDWASVEEAKPWQRDLVEHIVSARYDANRPIVFTSNEPITKAAVLYGARVASRLRQMVGERLIELVDVDWRTGEAHQVDELSKTSAPAPVAERARAPGQGVMDG